MTHSHTKFAKLVEQSWRWDCTMPCHYNPKKPKPSPLSYQTEPGAALIMPAISSTAWGKGLLFQSLTSSLHQSLIVCQCVTGTGKPSTPATVFLSKTFSRQMLFQDYSVCLVVICPCLIHRHLPLWTSFLWGSVSLGELCVVFFWMNLLLYTDEYALLHIRWFH